MTPAQLTQTSRRPNRSTARLASCSTAAWLRTSVGTASAPAPTASHSAATARSGVSARAARTTQDPSRANRSAAARPIPLEAPVITTTQRARSRGTSLPLPRPGRRATAREARLDRRLRSPRQPRAMPLRAPIAMGLACWGALALAACGGGRELPSHAGAAAPAAVRPVALSGAPGSCAAVAARTLRTIAARIEARAAADRGGKRGGRPALVARLTAAPVRACAPSAGQTVADTVGAVGERLRRAPAPRPPGAGQPVADRVGAVGGRLVRAEAHGPEVARALRLVAADPSFVRAVRSRDAAALRAAIVRFFDAKPLHIVRVRAVTASGRLVGDVGGPYVLAPASRAIRVRGRVVGRVTLSIQDDAGFVKLMRRFTGAAVALRAGGRVLPVSAGRPPRGRLARFAFATRAFPAGRLHVALLVPLAARQRTASATRPPSSATPAAANAA